MFQVVLIGAVLAILGAAYWSSRVFEERIMTVGVTAAVALVVIVIVGEGIAPGVVLIPLSVSLSRIAPLLALIFGGLAAYHAWIRYIQALREDRNTTNEGEAEVVVLRDGRR